MLARASDDGLSTSSGPQAVLADTLSALSPYFVTLFSRQQPTANKTLAIGANLAHYEPLLGAPDAQRSINHLLSVLLRSVAAQTDPTTYITLVDDALNAAVTSRLDGSSWRLLKKADDSLQWCAMIVLVVLQGIAGLSITGGVSSSRFYYEPMGVRYNALCAMPPTWRSIQLFGVGQSQQNASIANQLLFDNDGNVVIPGSGGTGYQPPLPNMSAPWSSTSLS